MADSLNTFQNHHLRSLEKIGEHKLLKETTIETLQAHLVTCIFRRATRQGKWLLLLFQNAEPFGAYSTLCIHNSMHGHLSISMGEHHVPHKHDRLLLTLAEERRDNKKVHVVYRDMRCWGQIRWFRNVDGPPKFLRELGLDAFSKLMTADALYHIFFKYPDHAIGDLLLRQDLLAGIGNIYRSEILHVAQISPFRLIADIQQDEWWALGETIVSVLALAYALGGSSVADFESPFGQTGKAQEVHKVYRRLGKPCGTCKDTLVKVELLTKRKVFFCPGCQP